LAGPEGGLISETSLYYSYQTITGVYRTSVVDVSVLSVTFSRSIYL